MSVNEISMKHIGVKDLLALETVRREFILTPFLKQRQPIMLYSKTGLGKSWYSLSLALAVAGGGDFVGYKAPKPRKVLYLDGEMSLEDLQDRINSLIQKMKLDVNIVNKHFKLVARTFQDYKKYLPDLNNPEQNQMILEIVRENDIELVIFDNYSTLVTSVEDENSASSFNNVMNLLQELSKCKCASVLVHHANKGNASSSYRGSSKMAVLMESIIKLDENSNSNFDQVSFKVEFEKFRQQHTPETTTRILTLTGDGWISEEDTEGKIERVLQMLKSCEFGADKDIYEKLGMKQSAFSKLKKKIFAKGLVKYPEWCDYLKKGQDYQNGLDLEHEDYSADY